MIIEIREVKEYHKNGVLMYETTYGVVYPDHLKSYYNMTKTPDGEYLVRIGMTCDMFSLSIEAKDLLLKIKDEHK